MWLHSCCTISESFSDLVRVEAGGFARWFGGIPANGIGAYVHGNLTVDT